MTTYKSKINKWIKSPNNKISKVHIINHNKYHFYKIHQNNNQYIQKYLKIINKIQKINNNNTNKLNLKIFQPSPFTKSKNQFFKKNNYFSIKKINNSKL